ncbi:ubiquitin carboxyl-terminal hydrolase [Purpureocillium lavendulum]|uniref:Ubiquitin carboxyl-terminal hydrolase n=1 Tax=Purpureocillium lavendulum TaxID=1247861 RepID=A0AB34FG42_9HYPO|nr:ubiquitin carboxyl-terminal hydrolase [Purpureocillium lavendulum]
MDSPRDQARLRQGLNPLTTSSLGVGPFNAQLNTPISAVSMASSHIHSAHTPASAIQPYNPQEWVPTPGPAPPTMPSTDRTRQFAAIESQASVTTPLSKQTAVSQNANQFAAAAVERFRAFAEREAAASADADRVRLFADFFVNESRIRRERYSSAISAMGSEIFDLTRDLFRPMAASRRDSATSQDQWTPASTDPAVSYRDSTGSTSRGDGLSSSAPASANLPTSPTAGPVNNGTWVSNYMPSLSPILSMSVSDNHENGSSRGRPPSRWWESDSQGDGSRVFERSKRESKYMGVPKDQWVEEEAAGGSEYRSSSEYPPEKTGWHDQGEASSTPQPLHLTATPVGPNASPSTYKSESLDVSRLVTMPPPYPRHHPAVNNNHPELATIRSSVRALGDLSEIENAKERFAIASSKRREEFSQAASQRRQSLRANLQREINAGNLGYSDAAAIESDSQDQEKDKKKELEKAEYELFQNEVIVPLNDLLTGRISRASDLFNELSRHLFDSGQIDADMPQEEGDDRPELLEKLTLLKWIFEMRETLHRAIYDTLSDRNARYCEVVMTPYRLSGNTEKLKSAEAFFAEDAAKRQYAYSNEVLDRAREFRSVLEKSVERGVALQLSAFWDIAPPLRQLLDSIPDDLEGFSIQIPPSELEENPAYREHPFQYLFSLLQHTEKSTYQFIESHTNLLCLLHEVKEAVVNAKARVLATQVEEADGTHICAEDREERARTMRQSEDRRLTEDLKEKVRVVQDQWNGALGEGIKTVKERTATWLLETGGWDEALEESAVFGGA